MKDRILKMSSTSEDGPRNEASFGRSAKMLIAASSTNTDLTEITNYEPTVGNVPVNEVKDGLVQFRRKLQKFIRKEGQGIANASMKGKLCAVAFFIRHLCTQPIPVLQYICTCCDTILKNLYR